MFAVLEGDLIDSAGKPLQSLHCIQGLLLCVLSLPKLCHLQLVCNPQHQNPGKLRQLGVKRWANKSQTDQSPYTGKTDAHTALKSLKWQMDIWTEQTCACLHHVQTYVVCSTVKYM